MAKPEADSKREQRTLVLPVAARAAQTGAGSVVGYAAVFNEPADIGGWFREIIAPGAFTETLKTADVRALYDHDRGRVLGRSSTGSLRLSEDAKGLAVEIDLPDTNDGRDVRTLIERGDISGMSFLFTALHDEWDETTDPPTRTVHQAALHEVSIVSMPAYDGTSVAMRSLETARADKAKHPAHRRIAARKAAMEHRFRFGRTT